MSNQMNGALFLYANVGVGYYHEGMTTKEKTTLEDLFNSGAIQVK